MPDHYSPKLFLQQIPKALLREYFTRRGELGDLDWDGLDDADVDPILNAWHVLPLPQQADIERWFRAISALATKEGLRTVIEECQFHEVGLPESFSKIQGIHEKIFWVYLQKDKVLLSAGRLNRADHLHARYWRRRNDLPAKQPDITHPTRRLLEEEISEYYKKHQDRGTYCTVQLYRRREKIHYFFAYPSDYADTAIVYNDKGVLERKCQQAAFEVIFAYNEATGILDDFVQGDKNLRRDLEAIFCRLVLKEELPEEDPKRPPYQLDALRRPDFDFPTNPQDKIKETRVKSLRLSIVGPGFGRIIFESDSWRKRGDIHDLIEKYLNHAQASAVTMRVTQAEMQVTFETADGPDMVPFRITHPDRCSLKDEPEHLTIKEYLRRWGIATEG
jgi:hypothetical protein